MTVVYNQDKALEDLNNYRDDNLHWLDKRNADTAEFAILADFRPFRDLYEQIGDNPHVLYSSYYVMQQAAKVGFPMVAKGYDTTSFYQEQIGMCIVKAIKPACRYWNEVSIAKLPNKKYALSYSFGTNKGCSSRGFKIGQQDLYRSIDAATDAVADMVEHYFSRHGKGKEYKAWIRALGEGEVKNNAKQTELF